MFFRKYIIRHHLEIEVENMAHFGELLAELRQDHNMTQKELADILFVSVSTISNYEKGIHLPDLIKVTALADYFHVTTDYLLGRSSVNLSPDVLTQVIIGEKTAGELFKDLLVMTPDRKKALEQIINDMKLSMMIDQYSKAANEVSK